MLAASSGGYGKTPNAFIFSLNNFERLAPFLSKVKPEKTGKAIDRHSYYGPKFGADLVIHLDAENIMYSNARLGSYYSVPASVTDRHTILKGPGGRFLKVPIIKGPGKLSPFTLKIEVSIVLHIT